MKTGVTMFRWKLKMEYAVGCVLLDEMGRNRVNAPPSEADSQALETFYFFPANTPTPKHQPQQHS
jgi:hypothetical protein